MAAPAIFPQLDPASTWHGGHTQRYKSGGAGTNAVLPLEAVRLPLVGQELGSQRRFSKRHLMAAWQWLGLGRHFFS